MAEIPQLMVLFVSTGSLRTTVWYEQKDATGGFVSARGGATTGVFDPLSKIEVERAKSNENYVHLRFSSSNRYWQRATEGDDPDVLVAELKQPIEDTSDQSCTLFEPFLISSYSTSSNYYFKHVQTGRVLRHHGQHVQLGGEFDIHDGNLHFAVHDLETIVVLPEHVAFKGDNGLYLKGTDGNKLQFAESDPYELVSGHTVQQLANGYVRILSHQFDKYWRWQSGSIYADSTDTTAYDTQTLFWPVKIDGTTIALFGISSGDLFCGRSATDSHLDMTSKTIAARAKMQVMELTMARRIFYVNYMMEEARIFDEQPYIAGTSLLVNATANHTSESVTVTYQDEKSYTFSRGVSLTAGVSTTIQAGIPFIAEGKIEVSLEVSGSFQWDETTTTTTSVAATSTVDVPPNSSVIIEYVGTKGTCSIPYSYMELTTSAADGKIKRNQKTDGTYTGVSCYNFSFKMSEPQSII